ncbi:hypothetical protein ABTX60_07420 [Streptomyces sp. NPDC126510]|uniref:hypothetical protein n=1 Tax=Streptomyces sp. NPDC126510 TaxID=3155317 RepID=UPI00333287F9
MAYKMTEDFATTMATVIPIVLVVGTAEVATLSQNLHADLRAMNKDRVIRQKTVLGVRALMKALIGTYWAAMVLLHALVEVDLIAWLATPKRTDDPDLAAQVVHVSKDGFHFVAALTVILLLMRTLDVEGMLRDLLNAPPPGWDEPTPPASDRPEPTPPPRPRARPLYPAHRAIRRPSRRDRSVPGR